MGAPTKFTAERRAKIIEALQVGASQRTAAAIAGIDPATLTRWIQRGESAAPTSSWARFVEKVREAEAHPKMRALGIIYNAMADRPDLAWKFIERREHGFAPPTPQAIAPPSAATVIQLRLASGEAPRLVPNEAVEGEVVSEQDGLPASTSPRTA